MPGSIRLHVPDPLHAGATIRLAPPQAHYLGAVMRRGAGDPVILFNGRDGEYHATIARIGRDAAELAVTILRRPQAAEPELWLLFAPLKRDLTELVVQKATELGATALLPVTTARTNPGRPNQARLEAIAIEAAEQCERLTVPIIHAVRGLPDTLAAWPRDRPLAVAVERRPGPSPAARALLVGPEGGFSPAELDATLRHPFVAAVSLGPHVLRAETAAIAGLALIQDRAGTPGATAPREPGVREENVQSERDR